MNVTFTTQSIAISMQENLIPRCEVVKWLEMSEGRVMKMLTCIRGASEELIATFSKEMQVVYARYYGVPSPLYVGIKFLDGLNIKEYKSLMRHKYTY